MKVLITGASGFVGGYLAEEFLKNDFEILLTGLSSNRVLDVTNKNDIENVVLDFKPDIVVNLAGITSVNAANLNLEKTYQVNVFSNLYFIEALDLLDKNTGFIFPSSSYVYGVPEDFNKPITESEPLKPSEYYSLSKVSAENLINLAISKSKKVSSVVLRLFNHIGPGQRTDFVVSSFANQIAQIIKNDTKKEIAVGNLESFRDFTDVRDIAKAYYLSAKLLIENPTERITTLNISSQKAIKVQDILDKLINFSGLDIEIVKDLSRYRAVDLPILFGSSQLAKSVLGWESEISLDETLRDILNFELEKY